MMRWGDYVAIAKTAGEGKKYLDQATEYGKIARAAIAKAKGE